MTRHEFVKDIKLIVKNCILYNGPNSHMGVEAKRFESYFDNGQLLVTSVEVLTKGSCAELCSLEQD